MGMNKARAAVRSEANLSRGQLYPFALARVTNNTASFTRTDAYASYPDGTELSMSYLSSGRYGFTVPSHLNGGTLVAVPAVTFVPASGTVSCMVDYTSSTNFTVHTVSGSAIWKDNDFTVAVYRLEGFKL